MTKKAMFFSTVGRGAIVAALSLSAGVAFAGSDRHGWYVGFDAGASFVNEFNIEGTPNKYSFDTGWAALGSVGYKFSDPSLRLEFEAGLRNNDVDERNGVSVANGEMQEISGFANLLWDLSSDMSNWGLTIGGGIGIDNVRFRDHVGVESRDYVQAAQGIVGLNYKLNDHWDTALTYRVMFVDSGVYDTTSGIVVLSGEGDVIK
ncbi:MAG: outer membrane beta-barrel protein, partial [Micropepsaceae bacterium]